MALFCRGLKPGGQIEPRRLQPEQRLLHASAIYRILAWRIPLITRVGRAYREGSWAVGCAPRAWQTMYPMQHRGHPPQASPAVRERVRSWAQLGGF